jgi:predicted aspartyl protease
MISGVVNAFREAVIRIVVLDQLGEAHEFDAVVDTGFNGSLTLPMNKISDLNLTWRTRGSAIIANGTIDECDIYYGIVMWDGHPQSILVEAADTAPLVGMRLMTGYRIVIDDVDGGQVTIQTL